MPRLPADRSEKTKTEQDILRFECLGNWTACAVGLDLEANPEISSPERESGEIPHTRVTNIDAVMRLTPFLAYLYRYKPGATRRTIQEQDRKDEEEKQQRQRELLKLGNLVKGIIKSRYMDLGKGRYDDPVRDTIESGDMDLGERRHDDLYDGSTMFRTGCGLLGLCRGEVQPSDKIFQIAGAAYPFILRKVGRRRDKEYSLVGIASIDKWSRLSTSSLWYEDIDGVEMDQLTIV
ncbi:hypothetical protein MN608_10686 [Microdochium nivale]|nr:hypothetical protein MN608_10686 [Microdochium nivale]